MSYPDAAECIIRKIVRELGVLGEYEFNVDKFKTKIKESVIILFFLTNDFVKSERFKREFSSANTRNKLIVFILLEPLKQVFEDLKMFQVIEYSETVKQDAINILRILIFRILKVYRNDQDFYLRLLSAKSLESKKFRLLEKPKVDLLSSNQLILRKPDGVLKVMNFATKTNICEINPNVLEVFLLKLICFNENLQQLLVGGKCRTTQLFAVFVYQTSGELLGSITSMQPFQSIFYSKTGKKIFTQIHHEKHTEVAKFNEEFEFESSKNFNQESSVLVFNDYVLTWLDSLRNFSEIFILDLNFKKLGSISTTSMITYVSTDLIQSRFLLLETGNNLHIANLDNFSIICTIRHPLGFGIMLNNRIAFYKEKRHFTYLHVYKVISNSSESMIEKKYICNLEPSRSHLFTNPYLLPCGNSACLMCIYRNCNIYTKTIKCNFETCKEAHSLLSDNVLKKDSLTSKMIDENCNEIMGSFIKNGNTLMNRIGLFLYYFVSLTKLFSLIHFIFIQVLNSELENKFEHLKSLIDTRIESLAIEFESIENKLMRSIESFEKRVINNCDNFQNTNDNPKFEIKNLIFFTQIHLGMLYNEYDKFYGLNDDNSCSNYSSILSSDSSTDEDFVASFFNNFL